MPDLQKVTATNITDGPKIFNAAPPVLLQAGQMTDGDVDISDGELGSMTATGWFDLGGGKASEPGPLDQSVEKLTAYLEGITDADEVQKLIDAETAGKSRSSALAALEARRDALLA